MTFDKLIKSDDIQNCIQVLHSVFINRFGKEYIKEYKKNGGPLYKRLYLNLKVLHFLSDTIGKRLTNPGVVQRG